MDKKNNPMMGPRSINEEESAKKITEQEEKRNKISFLKLQASQLEGKMETGETFSTSNGRVMSEIQWENERREKAEEHPLSPEEQKKFIKNLHPEYEAKLKECMSEIKELESKTE